MTKTHIIYIPGFGDKYDFFRRAALFCWKIFGVSTELLPMRWSTDEAYVNKIARINTAIKSVKNSKRLVIIGESAGGSMLLPALYRHNEIYRALSLCGKNHDANKVNPRYYKRYVAFRPAMHAADSALAAINSDLYRRMVIFYPLYDEVIPFQESYIPHCKIIRISSIGHLLTIFLSLTVFSPIIIHAAKKDI